MKEILRLGLVKAIQKIGKRKNNKQLQIIKIIKKRIENFSKNVLFEVSDGHLPLKWFFLSQNGF